MSVRVQWQDGIPSCFSFLIVKFVWKSDEKERKHWFVNICSLVLLYSYSGPAEIAFFSSWYFNQNNKHDTFWHAVPAGDILFYFYEPLLFPSL